MEKLSGVVERITYADEEKGFSVLKIRSKGYSELVTIVGNMASVSVGTVISIEGNWTVNAKFGRQFNVQKWEERLPASVYGIEKYLGSGLIKGIGPKFAKLIVNKFGVNTIDIIENEPLSLLDIPNIGRKRVDIISKAWKEQKDIKNIMIFLQECGVSTAFGYRIFKVYGNKSISKIKENPYSLADDVYGIGFKTADTIALKLGIPKESYNRSRAGIFYTLNELCAEGHCYGSLEELISKGKEILGIDESIIVMTFDYLKDIKELIIEEDNTIVFLPPFYYSELGVARRIKEISSFNVSDVINTDRFLEKTAKNAEIKYDKIQIEAIKTAICSKFSVITGGPGVGKTTITKAIINIFKENQMKVLLCAPTGRAAKRMSEACKMEAKTIHRLLETTPKGGFGKNEENKLDADVLIVDEASMIDLILMYNLLKAVPDNMRVILIGDVDQLPSVGAGNVLGDIISSNTVPVIKLKQIYRQAMGSKIITNAHRINEGKTPDLSGGIKSDFFFIEENDPDKLTELIKDLYSKRLPRYYNADPIDDIQVLTPMKIGELGSDNLNRELQSVLNTNTYMLRRGAIEYKVGDKVMQVKNNYDKEVFNGDIGIISNVNVMDKKLTVDYDKRFIDYDILELDELVLSYAITIHKSQGGEFPIIIIPVTFKHLIMLQRNLLYTGITRAKKSVILVGEREAIKYAVENDKSQCRHTLLSKRLTEQFRNYL